MFNCLLVFASEHPLFAVMGASTEQTHKCLGGLETWTWYGMGRNLSGHLYNLRQVCNIRESSYIQDGLAT